MLKTIRKYRRSVLGVVGIGLIALSMGGFGVNMASGKRKGNYAIKVGEHEISYEEFAQIRRNFDARYRKMLGDNYAEMLKAFNINVAQQAVDSAINNALLDQFAENMGLEGSSQSVQQMIHSQIFGGKFDSQQYSSFLAAQGMNAVQFEEGLRKEIARQQLVDLFTDASQASSLEAKAMLARDKTSFTFTTLSISPDEFKKTVVEPTAEEISKYYDDNLTDFQIPAQVSYNYTVLEPADFESMVPYTQDDIELEYTDNPSAYQTKPEVRFSQIVLNIADNASEDQKSKVQKTAIDLSDRIKKGEKFEDLAKAFSQDPASALKGGDAGWSAKDKLPKAVADKAFSTDPGNVTTPIETSKAIYIIRVEDRKDPAVRPLEEVKEDIIKKIQSRDAASVAIIKAQELYEAWSKTPKSLADFSKENKLKEPKASGKLSKELNPEPALKELTANVLASKEAKQQIIEIGEKQVLVEVLEVSEESVEPLDVAKTRIIDIFKGKAARQQARAKAEQIMDSVTKSEVASLKDAATKNSLKSEEILEVTASSAKGVVAEPQVRDRVFNYSSAPQKPSEVFEVADKFVLVELTEIKKPTEQELNSGLEKMREGISKDMADFGLNTFLAKLKSETKIDIQPGILAQ